DPRRGNVVTIPLIWLMLLLSILVHIAALWEFLPRLQALTGDAENTVKAGEPLAVRLAPVPSAAPPPPAAPLAQIAPPAPVRKAQASPPPKARAPKPPRETPATVVAVAPPGSSSVALPPQPRPATPAPGPPIEGDLASFIAARRRARGDPEPAASDAAPSESDIARRDRIVASNLAALNTPTFGSEPKNSGGIFQIQRLGYDEAEFTFFGWSSEIRRRASQKIEVRRGNLSDIRIAVIRKMIEIIRQYEQEDFSWNSRRLNRVVVLSARPGDSAGLEDFMMQEFFAAQRP
ncbi:MAG: hypothetical protein ABI724_08320, partial [Betaproteobacteria bacterium]